MTILLFIAGLLLLIIGAESLVKGASKVASAIKISPLVIGLTVVAFGTSSPEMAVGIESSLAGLASITIGNVVGSNIFNVLFILGLSALILPLSVSKQLFRSDVPLMIALSMVVFLFSLNGIISRVEGGVLVIGLIAYTAFLIIQGRRNRDEDSASTVNVPVNMQSGLKFWLINSAMITGGLAFLILGSRWFLDGAVSIAQYMGVSEMVIGLTIVAAGTSMPEVVTSVLAAIRGERDIAVGNVIGSNIFNILGVLGISSLVAPSGLEIAASFIRFDIPIMIVAAFACLPVFFTGGIISRSEGALLSGYYIIYTLYLILAASQHSSLPVFSSVMLWFVLPLTALIMAIILVQQVWKEKETDG